MEIWFDEEQNLKANSSSLFAHGSVNNINGCFAFVSQTVMKSLYSLNFKLLVKA